MEDWLGEEGNFVQSNASPTNVTFYCLGFILAVPDATNARLISPFSEQGLDPLTFLIFGL